MSAQDLKSAISPRVGHAQHDSVHAPCDAGHLQLWLALPEAAVHFDADRLTVDDGRKLAGLKMPAKRQDFLVSRALQQHVGQPANQSLTHSAGHAALACAPAGLSIGVDLERHRSRDVSALARFAFSEKEYADLASLAEGRRTERFYTLWVMKEALAKALQLPLLEALQCCTFFEDREGRWRGHAPTAQHWQVRVFEPLAGLSLALAIVGDEPLTVLGTFSWPPARAASWRLVASVAKYS